MSTGRSQVRHVLFYVGLKPGNLLLAEMEDGSFCILRDDQPIEGLTWPHAQVTEAMAKFQELKAQLGPPAT